jgi:hypothetical protein
MNSVSDSMENVVKVGGLGVLGLLGGAAALLG